MTMRDEAQDAQYTAAAWSLKDYRVLCMNDRYDKDVGRSEMTIRAFGPFDARNQALEAMREQGWSSPTVLRCEAVDA